MKTLKVTKFHYGLIFLIVVGLTILTRFYDLASKPIHFDESIYGWFSQQITRTGFYKYDPNNYHGPFYIYLLNGFEFVFGRSLSTLRGVSSFFSVLTVVLLIMPILKNRTIQYGLAFFVFFSPAFLFFGRSGIHEMMFVFFQIVTALSILRWLEKKDSAALGMFLVGFVGLITLKETFAICILSFIAAMIGLGRAEIYKNFGLSRIRSAWSQRLTILSAALLLFWFLIFTGFGMNFEGALDFFRAFMPWLKTGVHGQGHEKPWFYWISTFWEAEPLVLLGIVCSFGGMFSRNSTRRFFSIYALTQFLIYSLVPYKTVWCSLTIVWPFYLVLAITWTQASKAKLKSLFGLVILLGLLLNIFSSYRCVYQKPLDYKHPYIYVNSTYDLSFMNQYLVDFTRENPKVLEGKIQIGMVEQWPWPWLLRDYVISSYKTCDQELEIGNMMYFCDAPSVLRVDSNLRGEYWKVAIVFRTDREPSYVYFKKEFFSEVPFGEKELVGSKEVPK